MAIINISVGMIFSSDFQVTRFNFRRDFKKVYWLWEVCWVAGRRILSLNKFLTLIKLLQSCNESYFFIYTRIFSCQACRARGLTPHKATSFIFYALSCFCFEPITSSEDVITSRDGTERQYQHLATARVMGRNILHQQGGTKRFIRARVDTAPDIFFELFGEQSFSMIQVRTLEEAKLQTDDEFQLSIDELHAFVGLCIIRGAIKGRYELLHSFWNIDYGRQIFTETMSRNKFMKMLRFLRFDDKRTRPRRRENDKYAPIRDLWETVMNNV